MRKIYLHGPLADEFGSEFNFDVQTASEAVRALCVNFKGFEGALRRDEFHIVRGENIDKGHDLDLDECASFRLGNAPLHIMPVIAGSKRSGLLKTIIGVALIATAFATPFALGASFSTPIIGGFTYGNMAMVGVALTAAGVSKMLSPEQKMEKKEESFTFSGPGNAYEQGAAIPLVYGEVITGGGVLISAGLDIEQLGK